MRTKNTPIRALAMMLAALLTVGQLAACNNDRTNRPPPAVDDTVGYRQPTSDHDYAARQAPVPERSGMSSRTKNVIVLAGAAALYYLYKHHKSAQAATGADGQYYLSKNGRVYYRDADHRAHWVTPPPQGIEVPADEAAQYRGFQGYDNQSTGRDLTGLAGDETY